MIQREIYQVNAYIVDANGTFNHLDGYPKQFDSKQNNNDVEETRRKALSDYYATLSAMARRSDRQLQRANVVSIKTGACEEQYAFGELADLPDPEPDEQA
jgi:ribosomal protein S15P/S13E